METKHDPVAAKEFAEEKHGDQVYGDGSPYVKHLSEVVLVLERFGFGERHDLICAGWLHDVVEDTETTADEIETHFGVRVRELVWAVTNEPGKNRAERAAKTYPKIASTADAIIVKLADRIANVEASIRNRPDLLEMYRGEWTKFSALRADDGPDLMWAYLESLFRAR